MNDQNQRFMELETPWLTVVEAAGYLRVKPKTIYNWVDKGLVKAHKFHSTRNGRLRFLKEELDGIFLKGKRNGNGNYKMR